MFCGEYIFYHDNINSFDDSSFVFFVTVLHIIQFKTSVKFIKWHPLKARGERRCNLPLLKNIRFEMTGNTDCKR